MITIALPKGALLKDSIELFKKAGLDFSLFLDKSNRQLQISDPTNTAKALLVRAQDVPVYVEYGQAQIGIVGYDVLREKQPDVANRKNYLPMAELPRNLCTAPKNIFVRSISP